MMTSSGKSSALSLVASSLLAVLLLSSYSHTFPAAGTANDKASIPFVPEHDQRPAPILPRSSAAVLDFGDSLLDEGGNAKQVVKPIPQQEDKSSKKGAEEITDGASHDQQAESGGSSFRDQQVSIDDASEQDLPAFWRSDIERYFVPKISQQEESKEDSEDKPAESLQQSGRPARSITHLAEENFLEDDLEGSAQTIKGYASNVAPYKQSNTRFSDYFSKRPGTALSSKDKTFKPYNSAFSEKTAQKLSAIKVTNAKRFGFRG